MGAVNGFANGSAYVSSKSAMSGLTMCWRAELESITSGYANKSKRSGYDFLSELKFERINAECKFFLLLKFSF